MFEDDVLKNVVFEYSEWLDSDKKLLTPKEGDEQTHEDLVRQFFEERNSHGAINE